ncbi:hypothetical protein J6590_107526, partial [Homalodisca vitripennis]
VTCLAEISLVNTLKGGTPSFGDAMDVEKGHRLYQYVINSLGHKYHEDKIKHYVMAQVDQYYLELPSLIFLPSTLEENGK